jgi:hypothetical protein
MTRLLSVLEIVTVPPAQVQFNAYVPPAYDVMGQVKERVAVVPARGKLCTEMFWPVEVLVVNAPPEPLYTPLSALRCEGTKRASAAADRSTFLSCMARSSFATGRQKVIQLGPYGLLTSKQLEQV